MTSKNALPIPEGLPSLAAGSHNAGAGEACVMEYVSILAGESFSDHPSCTDPVLSAVARSVNDWMSDESRQKLVPLIGRLFGTASRGSNDVGIQVAEFINTYVHKEIEDDAPKSKDDRLYDYMVAVLDEFDRVTGFTDTESTELNPLQLAALTYAVEERTVKA